jgi:hypothetical protein
MLKRGYQQGWAPGLASGCMSCVQMDATQRGGGVTLNCSCGLRLLRDVAAAVSYGAVTSGVLKVLNC